MIRQVPLMSHNTCCSFPRAENHFLIFSRFNLRPSLSKAAAKAELVFTDADFPQPVYQLPYIIQLEFPFFSRSSVFPDSLAFRVTNSISCKPPKGHLKWSPCLHLHAFSALSICTFPHIHPISSFPVFSPSSSTALHVLFCPRHQLSTLGTHFKLRKQPWNLIWFFFKRVWKYPPGSKRQTGVYGQEKKRENVGWS